MRAAMSRSIVSCLLLNEVLSLNAQESDGLRAVPRRFSILNEVLSLNAQESPLVSIVSIYHYVLNEVLSLNAQE